MKQFFVLISLTSSRGAYRTIVTFFVLCEFSLAFLQAVNGQQRRATCHEMSSKTTDPLQKFEEDVDDIFGIMMNPPLKIGLSMLADNMPLKSLTGPEYDIVETAESFKVLSGIFGNFASHRF